MDAGTISLILNFVFVAFLLIGFLFGLKGLKKSGLRFGFFLVAMVIALFVTPLISKAIMEIKINYEGQAMTLNNVLLTLINNVEQISEITTASPTVATLFQNMPLMLANVVIYVVVSYVLSFISWILYLILKGVIIKNNKKSDKKQKKYRLLGGLVGAVQGLALAFITFLPVTGVVGIITDIQKPAVIAESTQSQESSLTAQFLDENLPKEAKIIIDSYQDSAIAKISNIFGLGNAIFNNVSTVTVDNLRISLRDEILNIAKVYDNVGFLFDLDINLENLKTLDYDKILNAIDYIFNSNILKTALPEVVDYAFDKILVSETINSNDDYKNLINSIKTELNFNNKINENLKNELICVVNTAKIVAQSNLIDEIPQEGQEFTNENLDNVLKILSADEKKVFNEIIDVAFNSKILNKGVVFALNYGLDIAENSLKDMLDDNTVNLGRIDIQDNSLHLKKAEVKSLFSSFINISNELLGADFKAIKNDYRLIFDYDLPLVIENFGSMMNAIQKMTVFKSTGIYNNLMTALNKTSYNKIMDFELLKTDNIWLSETEGLAKSIQKLIDSQVISYIDKVNDNYKVSNTNITKIFKKLAEFDVVNGESKTVIRQVLEPIYDSVAFSKLIDFGFEKLSLFIDDLGRFITPNAKLGKLNLDNLHSESEKENILAFVDNVVLYAKDLNIKDLKNDPLLTILNSDLAQLGNCLDSLKFSSLFRDKTENGITTMGVFTNLINTLNTTKYADYINFECTKAPDFRFNEELNDIKSMVKRFVGK